MNTENAIKSAAGFFLVILVASLISAMLGGGFAGLIALISPEFVSGLFAKEAEHGVIRYSFAVGMIWGLFIGAAVSGFACFLAAIIKIIRIHLQYKKDRESEH